MPDRGGPASNNRLLQRLRDRLDEAERDSMLRRLRPIPAPGKWVQRDGRRLLNLAGNDYLGLATHPKLRQAAIDATRSLGTGAGASRLVVGHLDIHAEAERRFAAFKHADAALLFPTGYMANLAVLTALVEPGDLVCIDKLTHASLIDAARACPGTVRVFPHLRYEKLERLLADYQRDNRDPGCAFIVTDSVFSMDGDVADLPRLCDLAARHGGITMVDEAHGTGVLGPTGAGLAEAQGVAEHIDITISTASKALGGLGGIVTGARPIIETLVNRARPFIYTTGAPPAQAATLIAALEVVAEDAPRRQRLAEVIQQARAALTGLGLGVDAGAPTPIIPLVTGEATAALALADHLTGHDILAVAIRPPTVAPGAARVRLSLRADLDGANLTALTDALAAWRR